MPKATEKQKKISTKPSLGHQIQFYTKDRGARLPCVSFKNRSTSRGSEDQSEPSPMFASNGIHMKSRAENLKGNGFRRSPGASQVSIRMGSQNPIS